MLDDILDAEEVPECLDTIRLVDLVAAARGFGKVKAKRIVVHYFRESESTKLGSLSRRRRRELLRLLESHYPRALYGVKWRDYVRSNGAAPEADM